MLKHTKRAQLLSSLEELELIVFDNDDRTRIWAMQTMLTSMPIWTPVKLVNIKIESEALSCLTLDHSHVTWALGGTPVCSNVQWVNRQPQGNYWTATEHSLCVKDVKNFIIEVIQASEAFEMEMDITTVCNKDGLQMRDSDLVQVGENLVVGTSQARHSFLYVAARIENSLHGMPLTFLNSGSRFTSVCKKCMRDARDLLVAMADRDDIDAFIEDIFTAYEHYSMEWCPDRKAQMKLAWHKTHGYPLFQIPDPTPHRGPPAHEV